MPQTSVLTPEGILSDYPELQAIDDPVWQEAVADMLPMTIPAGTVMYRPGQICSNFTLLLEGTVRIFVRARNGREIVLYRLYPGELCILSLSGLLHQHPHTVEAVAETSLKAINMDYEDFHEVFSRSAAFRNYVIDHLVRRLNETMSLVQEVAFERLDARLADYLCRRFARSGVTMLEMTHQELAVELGTTREVISRMLKSLERGGAIRLRRGRIELVDLKQLRCPAVGA